MKEKFNLNHNLNSSEVTGSEAQKLTDHFHIEELNPENTGIIGAASVSTEDKAILLNREPGKRVAEPYGVSSDQEKELNKEKIANKYEEYEEVKAPDSRIRAKSYQNKGYNSKIDMRSGPSGREESHGSYNLKTEPLRKKQRGLRGLIRSFMEN